MQHVAESLEIKFTASVPSPPPLTGNAIEFEFEFGFEHVAANYFASLGYLRVQCTPRQVIIVLHGYLYSTIS